MRSESEELLPEELLDLLDVGHLPIEGGAVHLPEGRNPLAKVTSEGVVDALVGVYAEGLPDSLTMMSASKSESLGEGCAGERDDP